MKPMRHQKWIKIEVTIKIMPRKTQKESQNILFQDKKATKKKKQAEKPHTNTVTQNQR